MDEEDASQSEYCRRQLLAALSPLLLAFQFGIIYGFSGLYADRLSFEKPDETSLSAKGFHIIDFFILILSSLASILIMKYIGRRIFMLALFPTLTIAWLLLALMEDWFITWLVMVFMKDHTVASGGIMSAISAGLTVPLVPVYIGEIADSTFRSVLLSAIGLFILLGMIFIRVLVAFVNVDKGYFVLSGITLVSWLSCITSRESPVWLMSRDQTEDAIREWIYLQGKRSLDLYRGLLEFKTRPQRKGHRVMSLVVLCMAFFVYHFSMRFYEIYTVPCDTTFQQITRYEMKYIFIQAPTYIIPAIFACYLMRVYNRRTMFMISGFGSATCMILSYILNDLVCAPQFLFFTMLMQIALEMTGLMPLLWILCGELSPREMRAFNAGIAVGSWYLWALLDYTVLNLITQNVSVRTLIHAALVLIGTGFLSWKLPETRGKTLLEIETLFYETQDKESSDTIEMDHLTNETCKYPNCSADPKPFC